MSTSRLSKQLLLPSESPKEFATLLASYIDQFRPATPLESELVETLAATRWRLLRLAGIEANIFANHLLEKGDRMDETLESISPEARTAWSFQKLADNSQSLHLVIRYETTLSRSYDRAFKQLQFLQNQRRAQPPVKLQNEPQPSRTAPIPTTEPRASGSGQPPHPLNAPTQDRRSTSSSRQSPASEPQ